MKTLFTALLMSFFAWQSFAGGESSANKDRIDSMITRAEVIYFDMNDFDRALREYKMIEANISNDHQAWDYTVEKVASSLYYIQQESMDEGSWDKAITQAHQFIRYTEDHEDVLDYRVASKKYYMIKNLVTILFRLNRLDEASFYQEMLYDAYNAYQLPGGMKKFYNFHNYMLDDQHIWAYESYETAKSTNNPHFAKHAYYVYNNNWRGQDKDLKFILQTQRIQRSNNDEGYADYVLTLHTPGTEPSEDIPYWEHTFSEPVNYQELEAAIATVISEQKRSIFK